MLSEALRQEIENEIKSHLVVVYMKGTENQPQCGFSSKTIQILQSYDVPIRAHNVLDATTPELREGIKEFTGWPTIPQIFINGEFIGGIDVLKEMHAAEELRGLLVSSK